MALTVGFAAAILGLVALTWLAWVLLHHPKIPHAGTLSLHDTVGVLQLVFASVAGAGALVALIVAYRRQKVAEADSAHDRTRVYNERFTTIAAQLGDDKPAVRLAGAHAMAGLADDWRANRQTCVDVLCAYLRIPYEPNPGDRASPSERIAYEASREVRHTVIRIIAAHLRERAKVSWQGLNFDFTGATFDGGDFSGANFSSSRADFDKAVFSGGEVDFSEVVFSGSTVTFGDTVFSGGMVYFNKATFSGGTVDFGDAVFSGSTVEFHKAVFSGSTVEFHRVVFSGGTVDFLDPVFSGGRVDFTGAQFSGAAVDFTLAEFSGGTVDFSLIRDWSQPPLFDGPPPPNVRLPPGHHNQSTTSPGLCENFLYGFKAARRAARAVDAARTPPLPLALPLRRRLAPVGWRDKQVHRGRNHSERSRGRGGFDKGTLAMAQIGLTGAGQKPARSPGQRTGHRPLSNPPLCLARSSPPSPVPAYT